MILAACMVVAASGRAGATGYAKGSDAAGNTAAADGAECTIAACDGGAIAKTFPPPRRTTWAPKGCRTPDPAGGPLASRAAWRSLHADEVNTDEVSIAMAPMFAADWVAEPQTWNPTGPVFDDAGNLYFAPFNPHEDVVLISLEPIAGTRRWAIPNTTGTPVGTGTPLVLDDPDRPGEQIVYLGLYDRVLAVRTDGGIVWDRPTGLPGPATGVFGVNYHPQADAIVGLSRDGWLYAVDRRTGLSVLPAPFQLPGEPAPLGPPSTTPPAVTACAQQLFEQFVDPGGVTLAQIIAVLGGNGSEVANYFSIDPTTGRLWVGATAPDAEDGTADGVSALGALYRLELTPVGPTFAVDEVCHASFAGGTASTPALPRDGSRVYVGDNVGNLLAVDQNCQQVWSLPLGEQIRGSIGVAADNREVYAATASTIHQVIDDGATARIAWSAGLDVFDLQPGLISGNANIAGIGANGVAFQAGAGYQFSTTLFTNTGLGLLDRADGSVRWFTQGFDETVAVMSTGPDGALYIGNSPLRRLYASCLSDLGIIPVAVAPPVGGIRKYQPIRHDVFFRDVVCAGADRARNARRDRKLCPASLAADQQQLAELYAQARRTFTTATTHGELAGKPALRVTRVLARIEKKRARGRQPWNAFKALCRQAERAML
ncbi:MAG: PQQ-binding-like beta-propeller repeat protein [bacterium]|nr:PQQ-binding-like beta-propeller repeat protein [bacterium]